MWVFGTLIQRCLRERGKRDDKEVKEQKKLNKGEMNTKKNNKLERTAN